MNTFSEHTEDAFLIGNGRLQNTFPQTDIGPDDPLTVLVVDDDPQIIRMLTGMLRKMAYSVKSAASGNEAISLMAEEPSDILITDINMPGMSGLDLMKKILELTPDTVVIGVTGEGDIDVAVEFMKRGGFDFLQKPVERNVLQLTVESAVNRWRLRKELRQTHNALRQKNIALEHEIEERERSEKALRESEEKYRNIFNHSPFGIFQTSIEGKIIRCNPSMSGIFGYASPDEMIAGVKDVCNFYALPDQRKEVLDKVSKHEGWHFFEVALYDRSGKVITGGVTVKGIRDENNNLRYLEGFLEDITEEKRQRDAFTLEMARARELYNLIIEPQLPMLPGVGFHVKCIPAQRVGGDIMDILKVNESQFLIFLADVSGHGIPAAMTAGTLKMLFKEISGSETDPSDICKNLNKIMYKIILPDDIIAAFCGLADLSSMTLTYCLCGLPSPMILRGDRQLSLYPTGFPLGVFEDSVYPAQTLSLLYEDILLIFTDGITEAQSQKHSFFGMNGIKTCLENKGKNLSGIVDGLFDDIVLFQEKPDLKDDIIICAIRFFDENAHPCASGICNRFCIPDKCKFKFKTKFIRIDHITDLVTDHVANKSNIPPGRLQGMKTALFEILTNAVEHGNLELTYFKKNPESFDAEVYRKVWEVHRNSALYGERLIWLECLYSQDKLEISVEDEGNGFDAEDVLRGIASDNGSVSGKGIALAKMNTERLTYNAKGNKATFTVLL